MASAELSQSTDNVKFYFNGERNSNGFFFSVLLSAATMLCLFSWGFLFSSPSVHSGRWTSPASQSLYKNIYISLCFREATTFTHLSSGSRWWLHHRFYIALCAQNSVLNFSHLELLIAFILVGKALPFSLQGQGHWHWFLWAFKFKGGQGNSNIIYILVFSLSTCWIIITAEINWVMFCI